MRFRFEFDSRATIMTLVGVVILLGLGTWQVKRLVWKQGIMADMQAQMALPPHPLPESVSAKDWNFRRASVTGTYLYEHERLLRPRVQNGVTGVELITPLTRISGGTVLINRGWIREADVTKAPRPEGIVQVSGIARGNFTRNFFTPDNNPPKGDWYWVDIPAMAADLTAVLPVVIFAPADENKILIGGQGVPALPNDHLQYAFFWYIMAFTLLMIYMVFSIKKVDDDSVSET